MRKILFLALVIGCSQSGDESSLKEAAEIHDVTMKAAHSLSLKISSLKRMEKDLPTADQDSLQAVMRDLSAWYDNVVEVPGFDDHDHSHGHDHDHDHSQKEYLESLTDQQILQIQKELKTELERLIIRTTRIGSGEK